MKHDATGGRWIGLSVFSHLILNVVVHRPDSPLVGDSYKVGLVLWNQAAVALLLEVALLAGGPDLLPEPYSTHRTRRHCRLRRFLRGDGADSSDGLLRRASDVGDIGSGHGADRLYAARGDCGLL
ncbi:MAG: hypothetical protein ACREMQ_05760 [Longimicrobiales bacterium]